jgi:hypothetical protein
MTDSAIQALIDAARTNSSDLVTWVEMKAILEGLKSQVALSDLSPSTNQIPKWIDGAWVASNDQTADAGTGGSLDTTLGIGNTTDDQINFDISLTAPTTEGDAVSKTWLTFAPLVKTGLTNAYAPSTFYVRQNATKQGDTINEVMHFGWNMGSGGGSANTVMPSIGESWESNYTPVGQRLVEKHEFYITPETFSTAPGQQIRLSSYTINSITGNIDFYKTVSRFYIKRPYFIDANSQFFAVQGPANGASMRLIWSETAFFDIAFSTTSGVNLTGAGFNSGQEKFIISGFNSVVMPGLTCNQIAGGVNLKIQGTTDALIDLETHNICDIGVSGRRFKTAYIQQNAIRTKAGDLTTSDLPADTYQVSKNTSSGAVKLYVNDGGTIKSITLT